MIFHNDELMPIPIKPQQTFWIDATLYVSHYGSHYVSDSVRGLCRRISKKEYEAKYNELKDRWQEHHKRVEKQLTLNL